MTRTESAVDLFRKQFNCAQALCAGFGPDLGAPQGLCLLVAAAFGGGMAREGEVCGALTGALMVLGLQHGREGDLASRKKRVYDAGQALLDEFKKKHGTLRCRELLGVDLRTPEGQQALLERRLHEKVCEALVREVAQWLEAQPR